MADRYERVLSRLRKVRWHPSSEMWSACCPAHDDRNPSLLLWVGWSGNLLARCKSGGCSWPAIVEASGTTIADWFPEKRDFPVQENKAKQANGKITATYPYHGEDGKLLYECCRIEPGHDGAAKRFLYRQPTAGGKGFVWNLEGVQKVLYRLPEIVDPERREHPVFVVEGEKDVETLRSYGFLATTNPCGAGKWLPGFGQYLRGRRVVILPDSDEPGKLHGMMVAGNLTFWWAAEIRVVKLPTLPEGGDVTDWLNDFPAGASKEQRKAALIQAIKQSPRWVWQAGETEGRARAS